MLITAQRHFKIYEENKLLKLKIEQLKNQQNQVAYLKIENDKLKKVIDDTDIYSYESITSKVLVGILKSLLFIILI